MGKVIGTGTFRTGYYRRAGTVAEMQLWLWDALQVLRLPSIRNLYGEGADVPFVKVLPLAVFA